ncbi:hypothetical protein PSPO01_03409 [Paraphaeosphaeria sporulosa]
MFSSSWVQLSGMGQELVEYLRGRKVEPSQEAQLILGNAWTQEHHTSLSITASYEGLFGRTLGSYAWCYQHAIAILNADVTERIARVLMTLPLPNDISYRHGIPTDIHAVSIVSIWIPIPMAQSGWSLVTVHKDGDADNAMMQTRLAVTAGQADALISMRVARAKHQAFVTMLQRREATSRWRRRAACVRTYVSGPQHQTRLSRTGMQVQFRTLARMPMPKQGYAAMVDVVASCGCWRMQLRADAAVSRSSLSMFLCA